MRGRGAAGLGRPDRRDDELRLVGSRPRRVAMLALGVAYLLAPRVLSDFWLLVLDYAGVAAVGAIGLNLLTGYAGQVSLGHAFFLGTGAYVAAVAGVKAGLPLAVWLPLTGLVGMAIGAAVGPFALRLRGDYLAIITLGLVLVGGYVFDTWTSVTGGGTGTSTGASVALGPLDFARLRLGGELYSRNQGMFWLLWGVVALVGLGAKNIVRTRAGRALQAVRDRELAAEVIGVSLARYKVAAFALSSGLAAMAGGLYGALQQYVSPSEWNLVLSITYIAMIIVGGMASILGSILGAVVITAVPRLIERYSPSIPGVSSGPSEHGLISVASLNVAIFGLLIVLFLVVEPRGLAALWPRLRSSLTSQRLWR